MRFLEFQGTAVPLKEANSRDLTSLLFLGLSVHEEPKDDAHLKIEELLSLKTLQPLLLSFQ
jgi:hypothetical protein